jgi:hypothetical protein
MKSGLVMALGEKLFTERGVIEGLDGIDALKVGAPKDVTFTSIVKGEDSKFPNGKNGGNGTITQNEDGTFDVSYSGELEEAPGGRKIPWKSHEKSEVGEDGKVKGLEEVTGFPRPIIMITEMLSSKHFKNTAYELK